MAKRTSQTAPGQAVYKLNAPLRVPTSDAGRFRWLPSGAEVGEDELAGLVVPALEAGGFIRKIADATYQCDACRAHGTADEKKAVYKTLLELRDHYGSNHPGLAAPTE